MAKFWAWFKNSEVVLWAQVHILFGIVWGILSVTDLSSVITNPKYLTAWLIGDGVITQWLRTRGTVYRDGHLVDHDTSDHLDVATAVASVVVDPNTMTPGSVQDRGN